MSNKWYVYLRRAVLGKREQLGNYCGVRFLFFADA
jgi:hypothetical protein